MKRKSLIGKASLVLLASFSLVMFSKPTAKQQVSANSEQQQGFHQTIQSISQVNQPTYSTILLDVPLENQNAGDRLENGCEVTALSMLLQYYGYQTNKNELAQRLNYVPFNVDAHTYGNPYEGFVGNIQSGKQAMGVFVEPIAKLAKDYVHDDVTVHSEKLSFTQIIQLLQRDIPVWSLATVNLVEPTDQDFIDWPTTSGVIKVTPLIHAVVLTGMDQEFIYVNDPYGIKNRPVKIDTMQKIFERLGQQSLYLTIN
ncbi:C39 family peptidase [Enterococcus columbae]|uniref:Peptidase C39-like domain-containing protein n=1 Tax=Enterococcus columbae DSM 7374 = ATCC 51263 TaxID=1121865 RepID=S0KIK6_9ENTE|nr:C39 family peptidase [Enterococcus columbae]EOT39963.1 hypothetical protein OMW_01752 [Enterococcus columbae DSM 7374 = ATCC 51263]EOW83948.1 hypothetical protein I568_01395 [Enterococcus columbae DSM 7374 = ATCC 51263]OJG25833.1 hypothetical protein RR47_GL001339 [Enterococcus columbae DSM 7374 = ATCC 51263]